MKKYLLFVILSVITLNAQVNKKKYKHFFTKKEVYHHNFEKLGRIYSVDEFKYDEEYKQVLLGQTKSLDKKGKSGELYVQFREYFKYDNQNRIVEKEREEFYQNSFRPDDKVIYLYDDEGRVLQETEFNWNPDLGSYEKLEKHDYVYNGNGQMLSAKTMRPFNDDIWHDLFTDEYTYENGLLKQIIRKQSDGVFLERKTFTHNSKGYIVKEIDEKYRTNEWEVYRKEETVYDNDDNVVTKTSYLSTGPDSWIGNFRFEATKYNKNYLREDTYSLHPSYNLFLSKNVVTAYSAYHYDKNLQDWEQITRNDLYYDFDVQSLINEDPSKNPTNKKDGVSVYPNPTSDFFSISTDETDGTLEIYDLSGRKVKSFSYIRDYYDVSELTPGVYVIVFKTENDQKEFKLLKK